MARLGGLYWTRWGSRAKKNRTHFALICLAFLMRVYMDQIHLQKCGAIQVMNHCGVLLVLDNCLTDI